MLRTIIVIAILAASNLLRGTSVTNAPFSVEQDGKNAWLERPDGKRFFSMGVCVVNQGVSRERLNPANPGYAAFQHYEDSNRWAEATVKRLESWKFTTVGGWSDYQALRQCRDANVAFIPVLAVGMSCGVPWLDMWDTNVIAQMHQIARNQILRVRDDPRLLGYYSDNEMGWWNAALFKLTLQQPPASGQRQRLMIDYVDFRNYNAASSGLTDTANNFEISSMTITTATVPEPSTLTLAGLGAIGLMCFRRSRKT